MRICIVGKFPPIEGGVSAHTYWTAHGLAGRGHEIHVVTNAMEVEDLYRMDMSRDDLERRSGSYLETDGAVRIHDTLAFDKRALAHIPQSNPFITKLASIATQVVREHDCEAILSFYLEPYAMAGYLASVWTGRPLIVRHAGSDLERLARLHELAPAYKEVLKHAALIVSGEMLFDRFLGMGIPRTKLANGMSLAHPEAHFNPSLPPLIEPAKPTIGIYGKAGRVKGSFDLLEAASKLATAGLDFTLLAMTGGWELEAFRRRIGELGLGGRISVLPFQPHWKVGRFIRSCHAVCFLERDFPIAVHSPTVPREVLRCGTCLVLSEEIASKQAFQDQLRDGDNCIRIDDPQDHDDLAKRLADIVTEPEKAARIGAQGLKVAREFAGFDAFIDAAEAMFETVVRDPGCPDARSLPDAATIAQRVPWLEHLLSFSPAEFVAETGPENLPANEISAALAYCEQAAGRIEAAALVDDRHRLKDLVRYQTAHLRAQLDLPHEPPPFARPDRLGYSEADPQAVADLHPLLSRTCQFVETGCPAAQFFERAPESRDETLGAFQSLPRETAIYCLHKHPNLRVRSFRIAEDAKRLLESCNGQRTTAQILVDFSDPEDGTGPAFEALSHFRDLHLILFT